MKTYLSRPSTNRGFILWVYMSLLGIGVAGMAGILSYSMNSSERTARNNEYITTSYVAESAVEKIRASVQKDNAWGEPFVYGRLASYVSGSISSTDSTFFANYAFSTPVVARTATNAPIALGAPFTGCTNVGYKYQIILTASNTTSRYHVPVTVGLELNMATINLFHNAAFWGPGMDLEINPGQNMTIGGSVYGGGNLYISPGASLTFNGDIASTGTIIQHASPNDPTGDRAGSSTFNGPSRLSNSNAPTLTLPLGTNQGIGGNNPSAVHAILDVPQPPPTEAVNSPIGTNRLYNKADLIVKVTDTGVQVTGPTYNNNLQTLNSFPTNIIKTNDIFYDFREGKYAKTTAINVGALKAYSEVTTNELNPLTGKNTINTLFVVDTRSTANPAVTNILTTNNATKTLTTPWYFVSTNASAPLYFYKQTNITPAFTSFPAVTLTNGAVLPTGGLTVATPDPVYIKGNYNVGLDTNHLYLNTADTSHTRPGAIMCDAISILSSNWSNAKSTDGTVGNRPASNTTVNAAFVAGNVPSSLSPSSYSGGLENFPRFLEDWSGPKHAFTYNGSMVCLFPSQVATGRWANASYSAPTRNWTFDTNFLGDAAHLPPAAPNTAAPSRGRWAILPPGATQF